MKTALSVKGLKKSYRDVIALENLSFEIAQGEIFGLLGHNGAGKSTTIECILGTRKMDEGFVEILGTDPKRDRKRLFERIGVQFQQSNYPDKIRTGEMCELIAAAFILAYLLVVVSIYGLGMMVASVAPNIKIVNLLCTILYFPMLFLSGATIPYEIMPKAMQKFSDIFPLTQGIKLLKGVSLGMQTDHMLFPVFIMIVLAMISIFISIKFFKWE